MRSCSIPKISVVIPAKNRANHLSECLQSVINQTHPADEIIVVDDHSVDDTKVVVKSFSAHGVRYELNKRRAGAQGARNHGILAAKYDWIAFQDSDDRWLPEKLAIQIQALNNRGYDEKTVIHCNGIRVDIEKSQTTPIAISPFEGNCYKKILLNAGPMFQGMLVSKKSLFDIGLLDENCPSFQEWETAIRLAKDNYFVHVKEPLFEWVCHTNETISKDLMRDINGHLYVLNKHKDQILQEYGYSGWSRAMTDLFCKCIKYRYFEVANQCLEQISYPTKLLAYLLTKVRACPRGAGRILKLSNELFG